MTLAIKNKMRIALSIIVGYLFFVVSSVILFKILEIDPDIEPIIQLKIIAIFLGIPLAYISGVLTQLINRISKPKWNLILVVVMVIPALISLFIVEGGKWSQLSVIFLYAPFSILGGVTVRIIRKAKNDL